MNALTLADAITILKLHLGVSDKDITGIRLEGGKNCFLYTLWGGSETFIDLSQVHHVLAEKVKP